MRSVRPGSGSGGGGSGQAGDRSARRKKRVSPWLKTLLEFMTLVRSGPPRRRLRASSVGYLRVNYTEGRDAAFLDLDVANDRARFMLLDAAKATATGGISEASDLHRPNAQPEHRQADQTLACDRSRQARSRAAEAGVRQSDRCFFGKVIAGFA